MLGTYCFKSKCGHRRALGVGRRVHAANAKRTALVYIPKAFDIVRCLQCTHGQWQDTRMFSTLHITSEHAPPRRAWPVPQANQRFRTPAHQARMSESVVADIGSPPTATPVALPLHPLFVWHCTYSVSLPLITLDQILTTCARSRARRIPGIVTLCSARRSADSARSIAAWNAWHVRNRGRS